jgi:hypothetical protein
MRLIPILAGAMLLAVVRPAAAQTSLLVEVRTSPVTDTTKSVVQVDNQRFDEAYVYLAVGGQTQRLGVAQTMARTTFTIPRSVLNARQLVRFVVRAVGQRGELRSREVLVKPGDRVDLTILVA